MFVELPTPMIPERNFGDMQMFCNAACYWQGADIKGKQRFSATLIYERHKLLG